MRQNLNSAFKRILELTPFCAMLRRFWHHWQRKRERRRFRLQFETFQRLSSKTPARFSLHWEDRYPCLTDATSQTFFDPHYIYHCAWAARSIKTACPSVHFDISSCLYFSTLVSAFVAVRFYDYRPVPLSLSNLMTGRADLTHLPFDDDSIKSLSCMHVVEHVGLGRYGDPLDPDGDLRAMAELERVLAIDGNLLFVVPVGKPRVCFNAHRIYSYQQVVDAFAELVLEEFTLIPDDSFIKGVIFQADPVLVEKQEYACGCFRFRKPDCSF